MWSEDSAALAKMVWTAGSWVSVAGVPGHFYFHKSDRMNWGAPKREVINTWHRLLGAGIPGASHLHRLTTSLKSSLSSAGPGPHCALRATRSSGTMSRTHFFCLWAWVPWAILTRPLPFSPSVRAGPARPRCSARALGAQSDARRGLGQI